MKQLLQYHSVVDWTCPSVMARAESKFGIIGMCLEQTSVMQTVALEWGG
jgi:hypothetical protein